MTAPKPTVVQVAVMDLLSFLLSYYLLRTLKFTVPNMSYYELWEKVGYKRYARLNLRYTRFLQDVI